jgi:integrase
VSARLLPAKDRSVSAAAFYGSGKEAEYRIEGNPGLVLIVLPPGSDGRSKRVWRCYYSHTGDGRRQRRKVRLGTYPSLGLADARARAARIMVDVDQGGDPFLERLSTLRDIERSRLNLSDLVSDYLSDRRDLASVAEIERELRKDVLPMLGAKQPSQITAGDIDQLASTVLERGSSAMARRLITHVKALYNYSLLDAPRLAEKYGLKLNPAAHLGRHRRGGAARFVSPAPRNRVLDDSEILAWWRALNASDMRSDTKLMLSLVLVTAQRPGELRRLARGQLALDCAAPVWTIPETIAKNGRRHVVPLSNLAVALLSSALATPGRSDLLFPSPDGVTPIKKVVLPMAMAVLFRNRLPHLLPATPHDLRRTAATGMRRIGVPPEIVSLILNHIRQDVTGRHYDHHDGAAEKREALGRWSTHLEASLARGRVLTLEDIDGGRNKWFGSATLGG